MSDLELLQLWRTRHDAEAFRGIVVRYGPMVYGTCARILRNSADAEDVTQDCFVYLAEHGHRVRKSLGAWLHRLAYHRSLDKIKKESRRSAREDRYASERATHSEQTWNDLELLIDDAIASLPDKERDVIVAYFLRQEKQEAVAEQLGVSRRTVSKRTQRGIAAIREHLRRGGVTIATASLVTLVLSRTADAVPADTVVSLGKIALGHAPASGVVVGGITLAKAVWFSAAAVVVLAGFVGTRTWMERSGEEVGAPIVVAEQAASPSAESDESAPFTIAPAGQSNLQSLGYVTGVPNATDEEEANTAPQTVVTGKVYERFSREPLAEIEVIVKPFDDSDERKWTTHTDSEGNFRFAELPFGLYRFRAGKTETLGTEYDGDRSIQLTTDEPAREVYLNLTRCTPVRGYVLDTLGRPVAGVAVFGKAYRQEDMIDQDVTSDSQGVFLFDRLPESERFVVQARKAGYAFRHIGPLQVPAEGIRDLIVTAEIASKLRGRVVGSAGTPLEGVRVHMKPETFQLNMYKGWHSSETDATGVFEVDGLYADRWRYAVSESNSYQFQDSLDIGSAEVIEGFTIVFEPEPRISARIRVTDSRGRRLPGVNLRWDNYKYNRPQKLGVSDENGEFVVPRFLERRMNVYARSEDYVASDVLKLTPENNDAQLVMHRWGGVSGTVVDMQTGEPVRSFKIRDPASSKEEWQKVSDAEGRFHLDTVPPGVRRIAVRADGFTEARTAELRVFEGEVLEDVEIRLASGFGTYLTQVVDEEGLPVSGAKVFIDRLALSTEDFRIGTNSVRSGNDGLIEIANLSDESHVLNFMHPDFATESIDLSPGSYDGTTQEVTLSTGATIEGRVTLDGVPLTEMNVQIGDTHPALREARTNEEGNFYLKAVDTGMHEVLLIDSLENYGWVISVRKMANVLVSGQETVTVDYEYVRWPTRLEGSVVHEADGSPIRNLVAIRYETLGHSEDTYMMMPDEDGRFVFEGLPPGPAAVVVWDFSAARKLAGGQPERAVNLRDYFPRQPIEIAETGTTQVEIVLPTLP